MYTEETYYCNNILQAPIKMSQVEAKSKPTNSVIREKRNISYQRKLNALNFIRNIE